MSEMEEKLGAILSNPQAMQQIMSMAQALGQSQQAAPSPPQQAAPSIPQLPSFGDNDLAMIQSISKLAGKSNIDRDQQTLLKALGPYLSKDRISKLEKAMRAAKIAKFASAALNQGGFSLHPGR